MTSDYFERDRFKTEDPLSSLRKRLPAFFPEKYLLTPDGYVPEDFAVVYAEVGDETVWLATRFHNYDNEGQGQWRPFEFHAEGFDFAVEPWSEMLTLGARGVCPAPGGVPVTLRDAEVAKRGRTLHWHIRDARVLLAEAEAERARWEAASEKYAT